MSEIKSKRGLTTAEAFELWKDELRTKFFTREIVEAVISGAPFPKRDLMDDSEYYDICIRRPDRIPTADVLDSLWPEFPNLSHYVLGTRAIKNRIELTPQKAGRLLREMYFRGENIAAEALRESHDPLKRALWYVADRIGRGSRRKDEKGATAGIVKLSGIRKGNFSQNGKFKITGMVSEDFARLSLLEAMVFDPNGENHTTKFRNSFPLPINGVYTGSYDSEEKGIKLTYKHVRNGDGFVMADMIVESLNDVCVVEVKNIQAKIPERIRKLRDRILRRKGLYWQDGEKDVTRKTLIVHANEEQYSELSAGLRGISDGVAIVSPAEFREDFEISLRRLEAEGYLKTNVYSVEELLKAYDLLANDAHLLMRHSRQSENGFIGRTIDAIINDVQTGMTHPDLQPPNFDSYKGREIQNENGTFQLFEIPVLGVRYAKTVAYLEERVENIPENVLLADIRERWTRGHIVYACFAYREGREISLRLALTKNPLQEAAVLSYLKEELNSRKVVLHGESVDAPEMQKRFTAQLMQQNLPESYTRLEALVRPGSVSFADKMLSEDGIETREVNIAEAYTRWEDTGDPDAVNLENKPESMNTILNQGIYNALSTLIQYAGNKR